MSRFMLGFVLSIFFCLILHMGVPAASQAGEPTTRSVVGQVTDISEDYLLFIDEIPGKGFSLGSATQIDEKFLHNPENLEGEVVNLTYYEISEDVYYVLSLEIQAGDDR